MFKVIIGFFIVAWIAFSFVDSAREAEAQERRVVEQSNLLVSLDGLRDPAVSKLVDEWRRNFPHPSDEQLVELRLLVERVKADPASAVKYTVDAKENHLKNLPYEPLFGWGKQSPGLNGAVPDKASAPQAAAK